MCPQYILSFHCVFSFFLCVARVIVQITLLLSDSSALPITLQDYIKELRKEFDHFMAEYQEDFHKANLSLGNIMIKKKFHAHSFFDL